MLSFYGPFFPSKARAICFAWEWQPATAQVLAARAEFPSPSPWPSSTPPATLDRAVDACCRPVAFATKLIQLEFLSAAYPIAAYAGQNPEKRQT